MLFFANAKINLGLNIVARRNDGFHDIETVFYPVGLADVIDFVPSGNKAGSFTNTGITVGNDSQNLCTKAYTMLKARFDLPELDMHLHKIVPVGAGLGGGSSDGAHMLKMLDRYFKLEIPEEELTGYASRLGSDCPFFLHARPLFASQKGDVFEDIDISLNGYYLVIVYPNLFVSTALAYGGVSLKTPEFSIKEILKMPVDTWEGLLVNDFEISVFKRHPEIGQVKKMMYEKGAVYASMSGSGSAVFGLFDGTPDLSGFNPEYFIWEEKLVR